MNKPSAGAAEGRALPRKLPSKYALRSAVGDKKGRQPTLRQVLITSLFCVVACGAPAAWSSERSTEQQFAQAKRDEPSLIAFLKRMPKGADLHNHLGGALYAETGLNNAIRRHLFFDPTLGRFENRPGPGRVPAASLLQDERLAYRFLDASSMRGWRPAVESGHDHFFRAFDTMHSAMEGLAMKDELAEVLRRARSQNIQYLELMASVAPGRSMGTLLRDTPPVDDPVRALALLEPRLAAFVKAARVELDFRDREVARNLSIAAPITGAQGPVTLRYIVSASRLAPDREFFAVLAAGMALMQVDRRVVGVNIVAPEDDPFARLHFGTQMRLLDVLWRHFGHPNITLHAGELTLVVSPLEPMRTRIRSSIEMGHARRIGHGVSIAWEDNLPGLLQEMRQRGTAIEICLTSNDTILGVSGDRHPFNLYRRAGIPVNLNTDDEGVNRSNLTMEYVRAVRTYNLSYPELKELARNSLEYSFLPGASLYPAHNYHRLQSPFAGLRDRAWTPSPAALRLMATSDRLQVQVRLERALVAFENR